MNNVSKIRTATIYFAEGLTVDGFELPDGSYHLSLSSASKVLGYAPNWLSLTISRGATTFKALQGKGFSGNITEAAIPSIGGIQEAKLISIEDFVRLIRYADSKGKPQAAALADAMINMSMVDFFRDSFGERPLTLAEKRQNFYKAYAASLTRQDWLMMDRQDAAMIEEQLAFVGELA